MEAVTGDKLTRPLWPYGKWNFKSTTVRELENNHLQKHATIKCKEGERVNGLQTFLHVYDKDLEVFETERGQVVEKEINDIMEAIVKTINKSSEMLKPCRLVKTGSVAEGTKIGKMNEFDFLLVLDMFNITKFKFSPDIHTATLLELKEGAKVFVRDHEGYSARFFNQDDRNPYSTVNDNNLIKGDEIKVPGARKSRSVASAGCSATNEDGDNLSGGDSGEIRGQSVSSHTLGKRKLYSGSVTDDKQQKLSVNFEIERLQRYLNNLIIQKLWEIFTTSEFNHWRTEQQYFCKSSIATTLHLRSDRHNIDVDIDICFCIPVEISDIENICSARRSNMINKIGMQTDSQRYLDFIKSALHSEPEVEAFAIIGRVQPDKQHILTRISVQCFELAPFLRHGRQSGQVKTYRIAKCLIEHLFPKAGFEETKMCDRSCISCQSKCLVKSYHIKNIILYMMENHRDSALWDEANIPNRVIEVFDILFMCTQSYDTNEDYAGYISTFSNPGSLWLKRFYNYDPIAPLRRKNKPTLITGGMQKCTFYEPYFWPEYSKSLETNNHSVNMVVKSYFENLKNENWTSSYLISTVRDLLYKLKSI